MNEVSYRNLKAGDLVRHKLSGSAMTVAEIVKGVPVLVRYTVMSNPTEWDRVSVNGEVLGDVDR